MKSLIAEILMLEKDLETVMESRVAVIAIITGTSEAAQEVNHILHDYNPFIIGRMGLPYRTKNVFIINIVVDAPLDKINALAGKLGRLDGVTAKAVYSGVAGQNVETF